MLNIQHLEQNIIDNFSRIGYKKLTEIQRKAIPVILRQKNALIISATGTGKTEAAIIPIINSIARTDQPKKGINVIYVTPLKALNRDIFRRIQEYAEGNGLTAEIRHGDTTRTERTKMAENPPNILITTPETLAIILINKKMRENIHKVKWVVIDEFHELISNERGTHLTLSLERLDEISEENPIRVGLSATLSEPKKAGKFLVGKNKECAILIDKSIRNYDIKYNFIKGTLVDVCDYIIKYAKDNLEKDENALLFTNTRVEAESLGSILKERNPNFPIDIHHGSLAKELRENTEHMLRTSEAKIVVCTSSLELGIDIGSVDLVIQFGSPRQAVKLIQRIGRSRHQIGKTARGMIVSNKEDDILEAEALMQRVEEHDLEDIDFHENSLDVIANHIAAMMLQNYSMNIDKIRDIISSAFPFKDLEMTELEDIVFLLDRHGVIRFNGTKVSSGGRKLYSYYFENLSTIPDLVQYRVIDNTKKKTVGRLDQMFVGEIRPEYGKERAKPFILRGNPWQTVAIDDEKGVVYVEPIFEKTRIIPHWIGELIPVDYRTAEIVGELRKKTVQTNDVNNDIVSYLKQSLQSLPIMPDSKNIVIESNIDRKNLVLHLCFGSKINQTLSTLLSSILSSKVGEFVEANYDAYRIFLSSEAIINEKDITESLTSDFNIEDILEIGINGTHPLNWKTWYIAKKFGIIETRAKYDRRASRLIQSRYRNTPLMKEVKRELFVEKYDVKGTKKILSLIKKKQITVNHFTSNKFSLLSKPIAESSGKFSALPTDIEPGMINLVKDRINDSQQRLVCMTCSKWESVIKIKDVEEKIICPMCRSRIITSTYRTNKDLLKIIKKKINKKELTAEETKEFKRHWKTSSLIQNFGKKSMIVLAGHGIGTDTAARILKKSFSEDDLYRLIINAERNYLRTRGFWKK
ncbi:MAG: DEAD/DEAH box helicase [Thermoproteota archaeon]